MLSYNYAEIETTMTVDEYVNSYRVF